MRGCWHATPCDIILRSSQSEGAALRAPSWILVLTWCFAAACAQGVDDGGAQGSAPVTAQVKLGRYQCRSVGTAEAELRTDLDVQGATTYAVGGAAGEYSFDPATRRIEWRSGPFVSEAGWVGRYIPQGVEGYATTSVEVWNRSDLDAGYQNPLQRCQHTDERAVTPSLPPAARYEVTYEVPGTGAAHISFSARDGVQLLQNQALPWSTTVSLDAATFASLRSEGTQNGQLVGCRISINGEAAVDNEPAPYGQCDARVPGG